MVVTETGSSITLKSVDGRLHGIARETIDSLRGSEQSLMPEGLEEGMSLKDMADLIAFLTQNAKGDNREPELDTLHVPEPSEGDPKSHPTSLKSSRLMARRPFLKCLGWTGGALA